jgi:hypothetical protein
MFRVLSALFVRQTWNGHLPSPATQRAPTTLVLNTCASAVIHRLVADMTCRRRPRKIMRHAWATVLSALAIACSAQTSHASACSQDIDRAWAKVNARIQARIAIGRSVPQSTIALLHRQPTASSIATAEQTLSDAWQPMETAVAALSRAHQADRANDKLACEGALADVQRMIGQ